MDDAQVLADVLELIAQLSGDWEYSGPVTTGTYFLRDLGLESLDLVVIGSAIQERYGRLPFAEFLSEIGERPVAERDISLGELVTFIVDHRPAPAAGIR